MKQLKLKICKFINVTVGSTIRLLVLVGVIFIHCSVVIAEESFKIDLPTLTLTPQSLDTIELDLEKALHYATVNNILLRAKKLEIDIQKINKIKGFLDYFPELTTTLDYAYDANVMEFAGESIRDSYVRENRVIVKQPVFSLYKKYQAYKLADINYKLSQLEEEEQRNLIKLETIKTYFTLLDLKHKIEAEKESLQELIAMKNSAQTVYAVGKALERDVQKIVIKLKQAEFTISNLNQAYDLATIQLKYLIGIDLNQKIAIQEIDVEQEEEDISLDHYINYALTKSISVKKMALDLERTNRIKKQYMTNFIPDLNIEATYLNQSGNKFFPRDNFSLGFDMDFTLFDWGKRELTVQQGRLALKKTKLLQEDLFKKIVIDVYQSIYRIQEIHNIIDLTKENLALAKENLRISQKRYESGYGTLLDMLSDQTELAKIRTDYYTSWCDLKKSISELKYLAGVL